MTTGNIIDIAIVAVIVLSIVIGAVRGLFKTLIAVVVTVAAIVGAVFLSGVLANPVTDIVYPRFEDKLSKLVTEPALHINVGAILDNATNNTIDNFLNMEISDDAFSSGISEEILKIAKQFGFEKEDLKKPINNALKSAQDVIRSYREKNANLNEEELKVAKEEAQKAAAKAFLKPIVRAFLIIILFILLLIILKIVAAALNKAVKNTPGVQHVNSLGGALLSFAECAVVIYVLAFVAVKFGLTTAYAEQISGSLLLNILLPLIPA